jgi:hypothetical protein
MAVVASSDNRRVPVMHVSVQRRRPILNAAGIAAVCVFIALIARFWHPVYGFTAFFQLDATNDEVKLEAFRALPVYVYRDTGGYDGLYYAQLALDPTLRDPAIPRAMDNASYRARRILPAAMAWLMGGGNARNVITAYSVLNPIAWLVLTIVFWRVLEVHDWRGWLAWSGVLFSAGTLCSVRLALTDLVAALLMTIAIASAERERKRTALASVALAALARETSLLSVAGLIKPPWVSAKNAARIALAVLPLLLWCAYVRWRIGPADQGWGNLTWPTVGLLRKWVEVMAAFHPIGDVWVSASTLLALVALCTQAIYFIVAPDVNNRWWRVGAAYVVLLICLGTAVWEGFPGAATRVLLPLTIAFNVCAYRGRAALAWLLVGNLGVVAGFVSLRDLPSDSHEIAANRTGEIAAIARTGTGWFDREQTLRHVWHWAAKKATVTLETWPKTEAPIVVEFGLRSVGARSVTVRQDGRELWHGNVGPTRSEHQMSITVRGGSTALEFSTDSPPILESRDPGGRPLAFALYDFRLLVPKR